MTTLAQVVECAGTIQPLPQTTARLAAVVAEPDSGIDEIVRVIEYDPALTADVLKLANSVMSASNRRIGTVKDAVVRLGSARILEQVIGKHIQRNMEIPLDSYGYSEGVLWRHSVASAAAAEALGSISKRGIDGLAFTAAILHDIGKLVIGQCVADKEVREIFKLVEGPDSSLTYEQAESRVLGFSHPSVGARIAMLWQLPDGIVNAIQDHHRNDVPPSHVTDIVKVSNVVARSIGEGLGNEGMGLEIDSGIGERLGLSREHLEALIAETSERFKAVMSMFEGTESP